MCAERISWRPDQRREQQKLIGQRYELLPAGWVREVLNTPLPLTEPMTLFWHNHFASGRTKPASGIDGAAESAVEIAICSDVRRANQRDGAEKTVRDQTGALDGCHVLDILLGP
ncbi:DUF1800 family protein [Paraburkholderia atlantica]|uniref:DUF1800 family protein n=1 Tax=Paraburkholderia atlantica TaxID=2654982 RepID=UPI001617AE96|nr:DUF1800 family protein [Paraburkholderia atlantica]MBB5503971.1 hypothetical protein [Paraburkholderia atlantica]